jgi:hypothetical protein
MKATAVTLVLSCFAAAALPAADSAFVFDGVGVRAGFGSERDEDFTSYELLALVDTPWEWALTDRAELEVELEGVLGVLSTDGGTAGLLHLGVAASVEFEDFPLSLVAGTGPTLLTEHEFGDFDLGGDFHFTSSIGLDLEIFPDWTIGYRYQHISNAGLDDTNPGLNLHAVSAVYDF